MSARVINNPRERMAVIMASPLMTCSARLPVYTILIAIMLPGEDTGFFNLQGLLLLALYIMGVVATLVMAYFINRRSKIKGTDLWSLELPVYRIPNWRNVFYNVYLKTKAFVIDAGKVIFIVSMVLWFLASHSPKSDEFFKEKISAVQQSNPEMSEDAVRLEYSFAGYLGKAIEPAIKPIGYDWKMGIAIISSFAAREVFVGALSTIYSVGSEEEDLIKNRLIKEVNMETGGKRYDNATIVSLLLFYAFALQCMSTMAIVRRETDSWKYPIYQFIIMFVLAYVSAFIGYRAFL
jgi:ferrous iron transport protein B